MPEPDLGLTPLSAGAGRLEAERRRREWLVEPSEVQKPGREEIEHRALEDPLVVRERKRVRALGRQVYRDWDRASERIIAAAERSESETAVERAMMENASVFGELRGDKGRWFFGPSPERREALAILPELAFATRRLVSVEIWARQEAEREAIAEGGRRRAGIPMPSAELAAALSMGESGVPYIAERRELLQEKRHLDLALYDHFSAEERRSLNEGEPGEIARRYQIDENRAAVLRNISREMAAIAASVENLIEERQKIALKMSVSSRGQASAQER